MKKYNLKIYQTLKYTKYMFNKIWKQRVGKVYIFIKGLSSLLSVVYALGGTIFPGLIINELVNRQISNRLVLYTGGLLLIPIVNYLTGIIFGKISFRAIEKITLTNLNEFYQHVTRMDYETLESPEIQDMKSRASNILGNNFVVVDHLWSFVSAIFTLISISTIIAYMNIYIILLIIAIIIANSFITQRLNKKKFETNKEIQARERRQWGVNFMLDMFAYAKELRLFNIKNLLIGKLIDSEKEINTVKWKNVKDENKANFFNIFLNFINQTVLYVYLIYKVIGDNLPIGHMSIFISAAGQFSGALSSISQSYLNLSSYSLNIEDYCNFINIPQKQYLSGELTPNFDNESVIEFRNVSFKYPGNDRFVLKDVNIFLYGNEKLCIVGANGAGKSTFIKLLTRLYFPTEGEILLNGININEYDYEKYQRLFAPVFQDFVKYYMTLGENIVLANKYDKERLDIVCSSAGLNSLVNELPKGYHTQVDKWIDEEGFEPSGGENQRIAIARASYRGGNIFILDEPTAALDPMTEYEIYTQFNRMITDKCAVLITHRLSAVQLADKVAVFDNGSVAEYGTHKELYSKGGIYTEMFDKQAQFYRDEVNTNSYS